MPTNLTRSSSSSSVSDAEETAVLQPSPALDDRVVNEASPEARQVDSLSASGSTNSSLSSVLEPLNLPRSIQRPETTELHQAVGENDVNKVRQLIEANVDVSVQNTLGITALHCAVKLENLEIIQLLLNVTQDIDVINDSGQNALFEAKNPEVASLLIANGASVNFQDHHSNTILHFLAVKREIDEVMVNFWLKSGADVNLVNRFGCTPLDNAFISRCGSNDIVKLFVESDECHLLPITQLMAYYNAASQSKSGTTIGLLNNALNINVTDSNANTALHLLITEKKYDSAINLINAGANLNCVNNSDQIPFDCIEEQSDSERANVIRRMITARLSNQSNEIVDDMNMGGEKKSLLHYAVDCEQVFGNGSDQLITEVREKFYPIVNSCDLMGKSPLHYAVINNQLAVVNVLLDVSGVIKNNDVLKARFSTMEGEERDMRHYFFKISAARNIQDNTGKTPLHYAAELGNKVIFDRLRKTAVELSKEDETEIAIPEWLEEERQKTIRDALLQKDQQEKTPLDYARDKGFIVD